LTLLSGVASAWAACHVGARRAGVGYGAGDMLRAPGYWAMQSLAFAHAAWRLVSAPHAWDKTPHLPETGEDDVSLAVPVIDTAGRRAA
jgi:hypothetical protein